jgi:Peptidase family M28
LRLSELTKLIDSQVSGDNLIANTEAIQAIDRHFTFPKFMESARMVVGKLAGYGLESSVLEQPADGTSRMGDWIMPLAWDCREATLELTAPDSLKGKVLCRRSEDPNSVAMWSAPTPPGGVTAEIVGPLSFVRNPDSGKVDKLLGPEGQGRPFKKSELAGKIVFTADSPRSLKRFLVSAKVAGVISSFSPAKAYLPHNRFWINGWADDPNGWAFTSQDTPMWCFMLTPAQGEELGTALRDGPVTARAKVESRLYEGILPAATGLLPGRTNEEILTLGHQFEIGADDSASGCAVMLEAARILKKLIDDGKLPTPERSLRWLFMSECYGSQAYALMNPRLARRTIAGLNIDSVGGDQRKTRMPLPVSLTPAANPSVADTLMRRLCGGYLWSRDPYFSWFTAPFTPCDSSIGDPMIDIPVVYLGGKDRFWHTTADTIDKIDPEAISRVATLAAVYAYYLASAGSPESEWLAEETAADGRRRLARIGASFARKLRGAASIERGKVLGLATEHLAYHRDVAAERVRSSQKFAARTERREFRQALRPMIANLKKQAKLEDAYLLRLARRLAEEADEPAPRPEAPARPDWWSEAEQVIPVRKIPGTLTFETIPKEDRRKFSVSRWSEDVANILFRCDGKRSLAEAWRLGMLDSGNGEGGRSSMNFLELFRFLEEHGIVRLRPARKGQPLGNE